MNELFEAIHNNNIDNIRQLLKQNDLVNERRHVDVWTALMFAAKNGQTETVSLLLDRGADIHAKDINGRTALMKAALDGHTETVSLLLQRGADINEVSGIYFKGFTALMFAAQNGHTETVSLLLDRGADIHAKNHNGRTALMKSAQNGHTETASLLLEQGADIHAKNDDGLTALMFAAQSGRTQTVSLLLDRGDDTRTVVEDGHFEGFTALMFAAFHGHTETVYLLLQWGADIPEDKSYIIRTMAKASWWNDSHNAVINNHLDRIQSLEYNELDITPLDLAIMIGNLDAVKTIIERGIKYDINACLRTAIVAKRTGVAIFFLEQGADPNYKDQLGRSKLHIACSVGNIDVIKVLVEFIRKKIAAQSIQQCFRSSLFRAKRNRALTYERRQSNDFGYHI